MKTTTFIRHPRLGIFSGHFRKRKGRWHFYGDTCYDVKGRWDYLRSKGYSIVAT